ncbi:hypothetical protein HYV43_04740 [Candidatus Micrarchaeota archaeon]|nr:hypothetical protein [Candidatus Micrarchaeota archaeon]
MILNTALLKAIIHRLGFPYGEIDTKDKTIQMGGQRIGTVFSRRVLEHLSQEYTPSTIVDFDRDPFDEPCISDQAKKILEDTGLELKRRHTLEEQCDAFRKREQEQDRRYAK